MRPVPTLLLGLAAWWPTLAFAEGPGEVIGASAPFATRSSGRPLLRLVRYLRTIPSEKKGDVYRPFLAVAAYLVLPAG
jgi:hypothetical protein